MKKSSHVVGICMYTDTHCIVMMTVVSSYKIRKIMMIITTKMIMML